MAHSRTPYAVVRFPSDGLTDLIKTITMVDKYWKVDRVVMFCGDQSVKNS